MFTVHTILNYCQEQTIGQKSGGFLASALTPYTSSRYFPSGPLNPWWSRLYCPDAPAALPPAPSSFALSFSLHVFLALSDICSPGILCGFMNCQQKFRIFVAGSGLQGLAGNQQLLAVVRGQLCGEGAAWEDLSET